MWSQPRPTLAELSRIYVSAYRQIRQESPTTDYLAFMDARAAAQYNFIVHATSRDYSGLHVLDIGCGAGSLLKVFEEQGARVIGFEPDSVMAATARARLSAKANVQAALFACDRWQGEPFDLVCMSHVLEHLPDPMVFLSTLIDVTKPNGYLFAEVPNETPQSVETICQTRLRGLMHLFFFNAETMESTLTVCGWSLVNKMICGQSMGQWILSTRRSRSLLWRALNKLQRGLSSVGLLRGARSPYAAWKSEWFIEENPSGDSLRVVAAPSNRPLSKTFRITDSSSD